MFFTKSTPSFHPHCEPNISKISLLCLEYIKNNNNDLYINLINENEPRYKLCIPFTLLEDEQQNPSFKFIKKHILIPNTNNIYTNYDNTYKIETKTTNSLKFTNKKDNTVTNITILDKLIIYTPYYNTIEVYYIDKSFTNEFECKNIEEDLSNSIQSLKKLILPTKEYQLYSYKWAKNSLFHVIKKLSVPKHEGESNLKDLLLYIDNLISKFSKDIKKYLLAEMTRMQKNNIPNYVSLQCIEWASNRLQLMQNQSLISLMSIVNEGNSQLLRFTFLYQPLEDYILYKLYDDLMEILKKQYCGRENTYVSKIKDMQQRTSHHPDMPEHLRSINISSAALELSFIDSEIGKTPLQKLICLKKAFIALESSLLELSPPTGKVPNTPNSTSEIKLKNRTTSKRSRTLTEKESFIPEYRIKAFNKWKERKENLMNLVLLLLIYHSPENIHSHLAFILFHTVNDDKYASLSMYYTIFQAGISKIVQTTKRYSFIARTQLKFSSSDIIKPNCEFKYHSHLWGLVNDNIETYPIVCPSCDDKEIVSVISGDKHIVALTYDGVVLTYGDGTEGQLGHGNEESSYEFKQVDLLNSQVICSVSAGGTHSAAVTRNGNLYSWGGNLWGQIGMGFTSDYVTIPKLVEFGYHCKVAKVSCGAGHTLALIADGCVWSWGIGANGRLGHGNEYSLSSPKKITEFPNQARIVDLVCGWNHSICISASEEIYSFGYGIDGQLGLGTFVDVYLPTKIDFDFGSTSYCSSFNHTMIISSKGLFAWGWGEHGELGLGDTFNRSYPCKVDTFEHEIIIVSCGAFHSAAVTKEGILLSWGGNNKGQLGHGDTSQQILPFHVQYLHDQNIVDVSCGLAHTIAVQDCSSSNFTWNYPTTEQYLFYSYASYCNVTDIQNWDCKWCKEPQLKDFQPTAFPFDPKIQGYGFIGVHVPNNTIVVSFRGTVESDLANWITDLESLIKTPYKNMSGIEVGLGFYKEWNDLLPQVIPAVQDLKNQYPSFSIYVTGHSLGAAISILCALELVEDGFDNVNVYNYGLPRVGNDNFANYYYSMVPNTFRIVNGHDIVPHLPLEEMGFHHVPTEVWEHPAESDNFKVCDGSGEDPRCSDSNKFDLSVYDHLHYLGYYEDCIDYY